MMMKLWHLSLRTHDDEELKDISTHVARGTCLYNYGVRALLAPRHRARALGRGHAAVRLIWRQKARGRVRVRRRVAEEGLHHGLGGCGGQHVSPAVTCEGGGVYHEAAAGPARVPACPHTALVTRHVEACNQYNFENKKKDRDNYIKSRCRQIGKAKYHSENWHMTSIFLCTWRLDQLLGVDMLLPLLQQPVVRLAGLRVGADVRVVGPVVGLGVRAG